MAQNVAYFSEIDRTWLPVVGGKGANLGELTRAGFSVPQGFCVTTEAYRTFIGTSGEMGGLFDLLDRVGPDDLEQVHQIGHRVREHLRSLAVPPEIRSEILEAWRKTGEEKAYAVRSSATAEDLPTASFAGQQDTYLNVSGEEQLLRAVRDCWASLFTDRAITYRARNGFGHRSVLLSVVIQQMVFPEVSGIMFTADPVTGRRKTVTIDASFGLGEALVSGLVSADLYQVRGREIVKKQVSAKQLAIYASPEGGTVKRELPPEKREAQALPDDRILELAALGEKIEAHYGSEQDIEWCLSEGKFYVVQSRPITSLYPVPRLPDGRLHVFISFGHFQMMTEAMQPLALSVWRTVLGAGKTDQPGSGTGLAVEAGGRLFVDTSGLLAVKPVRRVLPRLLSALLDEAIATALADVTAREDFRQSWSLRRQKIPVRGLLNAGRLMGPALGKVLFNLLLGDPVKGREAVISRLSRLEEKNRREIRETPGPEKIRKIKNGAGSISIVLPVAATGLGPGFLSGKLMETMLKRQLGEQEAMALAGQLYKSLPGSITTELGLAVGDLAETTRSYPGLVEYLKTAKDETFYSGLEGLDGGRAFQRQLELFMAKFGMRCSREIDIASPRWKEAPTLLVPLILSHLSSSAPGEHRRKFAEGEKEAALATARALSLVRKKPLGILKARALARLIKVYRNYMGLREVPKHVLMLHLDAYKQGVLEVAKGLVAKGILQSEQDVYYLTLNELLALEEGRFAGDLRGLVEARKKSHEQDQKRSPPRVLTSEGEMVTGRRRDKGAPEGALVGMPVSAGVVEGTARVILRLENASLRPGEILVAPYTDPGWTPLFSSAKGLVTEVGGMMTHGSVVAREYGIPAVVGVDKATQVIKNGSLIRVDGARGYVQVLKEP